MSGVRLETVINALTGHQPLRWQERLFREHFLHNNLPSVIDLPTGLGKTMVMAIWLVARALNASLPRRLIYVVDRRTVVDQATTEARKLQELVEASPELKQALRLGGRSLPISTLRGQLADNRAWSRDPSLPAIIIGTVDLIGSALLFSGYRSSYKRRPLEAGLLGQDSLLILDEAHLSKPFEKLVTSITQFQHNQGSPMQVIRMSATSDQTDGEKPAFTLQLDNDGSLTGEDAGDMIVSERFCAKKRLTVTTLGEKDDLNKKLAAEAIDLAQSSDIVGKRIVVFVRSPEDARSIAEKIRGHARPAKSKSNPDPCGQYANSVEILTGTMRGLERDELVNKRVFEDRWLNGELNPSDPANQQHVFLISTSAGEVGFDLNADHMVCDAAPLDSLIQRLGRVNRRGKGSATVIVVKKESAGAKDFDRACAAASELLTDGMDVSPKAMAALKKALTSDQINSASSPEPVMAELTDILLDAWSMTSITEPMPGRPEIAPWLRGIADNLPQTTIAWRAELDLRGFDELDLEDIGDWFDSHRVQTHETLSVTVGAATKWFADRWANLTDAQKLAVGARPILIDRAGLRLVTVKELIEQLSRKNTDAIRNADLVVPASFGGIDRGTGLLEPAIPRNPVDEDEAIGDAIAEARRAAPDVADERGRFREIITTTEDGATNARSIGSGMKPANANRFVLELESGDDTQVRLVSHVSKQDKPEVGAERQSLSEHVRRVREQMDQILCRLDLPESLSSAAELGADYHDHGKNRERWQRLVNGKATPPGRRWFDATIGKSGGAIKRDPRHYRHEFGSLCEFIDVQGAAAFIDSNGAGITQDVADLALHLIATHHGRGRPHFPKGGFDPNGEPRSPETHADVIRRFTRLQRKYGWWRLAWLENLLRCADALASADEDFPNDNRLSESRVHAGGNG